MPTCRPRFVLWTAVLRQLPLQLFLSVWAGLFFGGFAAFLGGVAAMTRRGSEPGDVAAAMLSGPALFGSIAFVAVPLVTVGAKWLNYRNTRYMIDARHIAVEEGFFTVQAKRVLIEDVREVSLRRGPLQRLSGVGSVYLASRVTGGGGAWRGTPLLGATSVTGSGVMLMDLPNWREVYDTMQRRLTA